MSFSERHPGLTGFTVLFGLLAAIAVIVLGGWLIGWWFNTQNVNRESHLIRNSYSNQQTLRDQITQQLGNVTQITVQIAETSGAEKSALEAQRYTVVGIVCNDASEVVGDPLPQSQTQFVQSNCELGNVRPSSPYTQGVNP